jgi:catechol 2,3-dioxygenase-like lactoylglutathione lyase family enzyme
MLALEVVPLPVLDVDRALSFYTRQVGFTLDVDYRPTSNFRVVQLTPLGSACSIHLVQRSESTPLRDLCLVTDNLETTHRELSSRGVPISATRHKDPVDTWAGAWAPGLDFLRRDYCSFADFTDPDGNTWTVQERGYRPS